MPQPCSICVHPHREEIDRDIVSGAPNRRIATQYGLSESAVRRHKAGHLPPTIAKAGEAIEVAHADTLLDQVHTLLDKARSLTDQAEEAGDLRIALQGIREVRGVLELLAKVTGELQAGPVVGIIMSPEWTTLRTAILRALESFPDARQAILQALDQLPSSAPLQEPVTEGSRYINRVHTTIHPVRLADRLQGGDVP